MSSLYSVIQSFVVTNKSTDGEVRGVYTCYVHPAATKIDIKNAIKQLYGAEVARVNVMRTREKFHFTRQGISRKRAPRKKALITLKNGQKIANFEKLK